MARLIALLLLVGSVSFMAWYGYSLYYEKHILDKSILTHQPCAPPCWYGIRPGDRIPSADLLHIIESMTAVVGAERDSDMISWHWRKWPGSIDKRWLPGNNWIALKDGAVSEINLLVDFPVSVEDILDLYEEPTTTNSLQRGLPEHPYVYFRMFYPKQGLIVAAAIIPYQTPVLEPTTQIYEVFYRKQVESMGVWRGYEGQERIWAPMPAYGRLDESIIERH
jgi:hypothetical protein